ncbi:MAG: Ser-Thr-rich GPI-anchored membrane family protein, partial [Promethearchaeota archaeon]
PASFEITAPDIIRVTSPTAETSWQAGSTQTITWNSTGTITNVDIDLYYLGIRSYIARNILNEGSYSWTLNTSYTYYTDYYQIRISDSNNPSTFSSSPYFEITPITHIDNITVTNPTAETSWQAGTTQTITWTSTGSITNVDIDLYYLGKNHSTIAKSTSNKGSYSWMLASYYANYTDSYQIRISDSSNPSIYGYSPTFFQITAPGGVDTITITSPTEKTSWQAGTTQNITWTSTGSISHVHIHLYHSGRYHSTIVLNTLNDGSYSWTLNSSYTDYTDSYRIRISDSSNLSTHDMSPSYFEITEKNKYAASRVDLGVEVFILIGVVSIVIVGTTSLGYISFKKHRK